MKKLRMTVWVFVLLGSFVMAAEAQDGVSGRNAIGNTQNKSDTGSQVNMVVHKKKADNSLAADMYKMMGRLNKMMNKITVYMKKRKPTDIEEIKKLSTLMNEMSGIIKNMAYYMEKGEIAEMVVNDLNRAISDLESAIDNL